MSKYLKEKLKRSDTAVEALGLDGESLFNIECCRILLNLLNEKVL